MQENHTYEKAVDRLYHIGSNKAALAAWRKERRENKKSNLIGVMQAELKRIDLDISEMSFLHITGTKGKGSTCAFTENLVRSHGFTTGMFTSPHLVHPRERIRLNGKPLTKEMFTKYFWKTYTRLEKTRKHETDMPGFFRFLTLMGFRVFHDEKVDVSIIEVGIGGRTCPTNVMPPPVACCVTTLGYDHVELLGNTLTEIAYEKAGIFKAGSTAFSSPQKAEGMRKLEACAKEVGLPFAVARDLRSYSNGKGLQLGLAGKHQEKNASVAVELAKAWLTKQCDTFTPFTDTLPPTFVTSLTATKWPGRLQNISITSAGGTKIPFYIDGAHTYGSMRVCLKYFRTLLTNENEHVFVVFNCKSTKPPAKLLQVLFKYKMNIDQVLFTTYELDKNPTTEQDLEWQQSNYKIYRKFKLEQDGTDAIPLPENGTEGKDLFKSIPRTVEYITDFADAHKDKTVKVLVTGSLYLAGGILDCFIKAGYVEDSILDL